MAHPLNSNSFFFGLMARLRGLVQSFKTARANQAAFNAAYGELLHLSDRELMEFGLHRSDLVNLARVEAFRR